MKIFFTFILAFAGYAAIAQTGTYRFEDKTGASCTIKVVRKGQYITGDVFAWWHTTTGQHGVFTGEGVLKNNTCLLKWDEDTDCNVTLTFAPGSLKAKFDNCMASNLPEDFSGTYKKVTGNHKR